MRKNYFRYFLFIVLTIFTFTISDFVFAEHFGVLNRVDTQEKKIAITFDADMTPKMLEEYKSGKVKSWYNQEVIDTLKKENIPATLFLTGMWVELYSTTTSLLAGNNLFEIANHSYSHPAFEKECFKLKAVRGDLENIQIEKTDKLLQTYALNYKKYFRFPGLCYGKKSLDIVKQTGYIAVGGDVFGQDGFEKNPKRIVRNVLNRVKPGSIIILHMMGGPNAPETGNALPEIIAQLKKDGFTFVKVSDLINSEKK